MGGREFGNKCSSYTAVIYLRSMQPLLRVQPTRGSAYDCTWEQCRHKMKNFVEKYKKVDKHEACVR